MADQPKKDVATILKENSGIQLDIGCGRAKQEGFVGMDIRPLPEVDIVHNWNSIPWPLPDESVSIAIASHVVEHILPVAMYEKDGEVITRFPFVEFMNEVWRVMKVGGKLMISTPHGYSPGYLQDPTHCNPINEATFAYFDPMENRTQGLLWRIYEPKPWRLEWINWNPAGNIQVHMRKRPMDWNEKENENNVTSYE